MYQSVKDAVLKAYEQVPEVYRRKFRNSIKDDKQTYVQFAHEKERLFDGWCTSQEVEGDYTRLRELLLIDENKVETFHRAATLADIYSHPPKDVC